MATTEEKSSKQSPAKLMKQRCKKLAHGLASGISGFCSTPPVKKTVPHAGLCPLEEPTII